MIDNLEKSRDFTGFGDFGDDSPRLCGVGCGKIGADIDT